MLQIGVPGLIFELEIARCFGDSVKAGSLSAQMNRHITPNVKLIKDALARGENPGAVPLGGLYGKYKDNKNQG